jgi:hypothetical protein
MNQENDQSRRLIVGLIVGAVFGLGIGLLLGLVFAYVISPVEWVDGAPQDLREDYAAYYWQLVAESYRIHGDPELAQKQLGEWTDQERLQAALDRAHIESSPEQQQVLQTLSNRLVVGAATPQATPGATRPAETGSGPAGVKINWGTFLLTLALILLVLVAIGLFVSRARKSRMMEGELEELPGEAPELSFAAQQGEAAPDSSSLVDVTPRYTLGREHFDESESIEISTGLYVGDCGILVAGYLDEDSPDRVTAIEVWLFDKYAIQTVRKVLMSEYAYNNETLRERLKEKGELVLAEPYQPVLLETAALRVEATITDLVYGMDDSRPNSYFEQFNTRLVARQVGPIVDALAGPRDELGI